MRACIVLALVLSCAGPCLAISFEDLLASYDVLQTVAGTARITGGGINGWQSAMEGGPAIEAELSRPHITMADLQGNLYIADKDAHAIRRVNIDGTIHTIAGTNIAGFNGDGPGVSRQLDEPNGLYTFPDGTTYILDLGNSMVRKLSTDGQLTTVFEDPQGIFVGRGLWVSPDESTILYSAGSQVRKWTAGNRRCDLRCRFRRAGQSGCGSCRRTVFVTDLAGHSVYRL